LKRSRVLVVQPDVILDGFDQVTAGLRGSPAAQ
jgi:hypothetical protein